MSSTIDYNTKLRFDSTGTKIAFDTNGYVGIGTATPVSNIDTREESNGGTVELRLTNSYYDTTSIDEYCAITFCHASATYPASKIICGREGSFYNLTDRKAYLAFGTIFENVFDERMRLTAEGKLGIDTTSPLDLLSVEGQISVTLAGDRKFKVDSTGQIYSDAGTTIFTPADLAEWSKVDGPLESYGVGTIVQQSDIDLTVKLADNTDNRVYGVVTDRATFLGSLTGVDKSFLKELTDEEIEREFNANKIAMVGHVQVRVKNPIQIGQSLTLSEEIGVARVALTFEEKALSFGIARESYDSTDVGIIEARLF